MPSLAMQLAHHRVGSGPPLVLVHGIGSHWPAWEALLPWLARSRDVVAVSLPGFGKSPMLPGAPTLEALADAVAGFAEGELGLRDWHVAGNSLGGGVALHLARTGRVRSACALSPIGFWSERELAYARAVLRFSRRAARSAKPLAPALSRSAAGRAALTGLYVARPARMSPGAVASAIANLADSPGFEATLDHAITGRFEPPLDELPCPVTIAWGTRDSVLLPWQAGRARGLVPRARHVPLTGLGHVPMTDDPGVVSAVLLRASGG